MRKTYITGLILFVILTLLTPLLSLSESGEKVIIKLPGTDISCDAEGKAEFSVTLTNTGETDLNDVSLVLESLADMSDPESIIGEITALSVNGVAEEEPSDYLWIDSFQPGSDITIDVRFDFAGSESKVAGIRISLCDDEYCEIAVAECRCTWPANDVQGLHLNIAGVPVAQILLILVALNILLWTGVLLTNKRKKNRENH